MDANAFLDTARKLASPGGSEADLRSSVSRSYYAAYHKIQAAVRATVNRSLISQAGFAKKAISHHKLIEWLKSTADVEVKSLGDDLGNFKEDREWADYRLHEPTDWQDKSAAAIEEAIEQRAIVDNLTAKRIGLEVEKYLQQILRPKQVGR